jgi:hypothetical protein
MALADAQKISTFPAPNGPVVKKAHAGSMRDDALRDRHSAAARLEATLVVRSVMQRLWRARSRPRARSGGSERHDDVNRNDSEDFRPFLLSFRYSRLKML